MPIFLKEWLDAAASVAGLVAGLPYEPVTMPRREAEDAQLRLPFDASPAARGA